MSSDRHGYNLHFNSTQSIVPFLATRLQFAATAADFEVVVGSSRIPPQHSVKPMHLLAFREVLGLLRRFQDQIVDRLLQGAVWQNEGVPYNDTQSPFSIENYARYWKVKTQLLISPCNCIQ